MAGPTYDYEAEQAALARQLKVAEAMQMQGMAPMGGTEAVGGVAVKRSPLEGIAKLLQAYAGGRGVDAAEAGRKALGQRYAGELRTGMEGLIDSLSQTASPADGMGPPMSQEQLQGSKRAAIMRAIASNHPTLQALGTSQLAEMQKIAAAEAIELGPRGRPERNRT